MSIKVLLVEDEEPLRMLLAYTLDREGFEVEESADGADVAATATKDRPDIVLLDWMLPVCSGLTICKQLRAQAETHDIPIVMLTARSEEEDKLRAFEAGADDYITKPFSTRELVARIRAVLRRGQQEVGEVIRFGDIILDQRNCRARRGGREVPLGPTEFRLLHLLMQWPQRAFTRDELLARIWSDRAIRDVRVVDVTIGRLRRALNRPGDRDPIRTVRSVGYALDDGYAQRPL
jgi:two-component system phosphate regulon response regulator PhoB